MNELDKQILDQAQAANIPEEPTFQEKVRQAFEDWRDIKRDVKEVTETLHKIAETKRNAIEEAWRSKPHHCGVFHGSDKYEECIVLNHDEFYKVASKLFVAGQQEMRGRITNRTSAYDKDIKIETPETL